MECDKVREELPNIKFEKCCQSCHEDEETGFGNDLYTVVNGRDRNVCCAIMRSLEKVSHDKTRNS